MADGGDALVFWIVKDCGPHHLCANLGMKVICIALEKADQQSLACHCDELICSAACISLHISETKGQDCWVLEGKRGACLKKLRGLDADPCEHRVGVDAPVEFTAELALQGGAHLIGRSRSAVLLVFAAGQAGKELAPIPEYAVELEDDEVARVFDKIEVALEVGAVGLEDVKPRTHGGRKHLSQEGCHDGEGEARAEPWQC